MGAGFETGRWSLLNGRFPPIADIPHSRHPRTVRAQLRNWITFGVALIGSLLAIVVAVGLLNFTGDCASEVTNCGEPHRHASFVVLGLGIVWIVYLIVRFIRSARRFR